MAKRFLFTICLCLMGLIPLTAQETPTLVYGEAQSFTLAADSTTSFVFEGALGDTIMAIVPGVPESGGITLRLFNPQGGFLAEGNNSSHGVQIPVTVLTANGQYRLEIARAADSADVELSILVEPVTSTAINVGDTISGTFANRGSLAVYTFTTTTPDMLFAYQTTCTECTLVIQPPLPDGDWVGDFYVQDNQFEPLLLLPEVGLYTVYLQSQAAGSDYTVTLYSPEPTPITPNEPVSGKIVTDTWALYSFESGAGKIWQVTGNIAPGYRSLAIYFLEGRASWQFQIAVDDDSGSETQPAIRQFIAPETGTYYIMLNYVNWDGIAEPQDYELTLAPDTLLQLAPDTPFTGEITPETGEQTYHYEGQAGEAIRVTVERTTDTGALGLRVLSSEDEVLVYYERGVKRAVFEVTLPLDGRYRFVLQNLSYDLGALGYSILIEKP